MPALFEKLPAPVTKLFNSSIFLAIVSGALASCAFPPIDIPQLALIAWIPFFWALNDRKPSQALLLGLLHGFTLFGITTSWLWDLFGAPAMIIWLILATFSGVFSRFYVSFTKKGWLSCVLGAVLWTGIEFFRAEIFTLYFPWMSPGVGYGPSILSPLIGCYGVSFLIVFSGLLITLSDKTQINKLSKIRITGASILCILTLISIIPLNSDRPKKPVSVLAVQSEKHGVVDKQQITQEAIQQHGVPQMVVWPELAIPPAPRRAASPYQKTLNTASSIPTLFISGATITEKEGDYNAAVTIHNNELLGSHFKNHPVPLLLEGIKGHDANAVETHLGKIGTPICYDCDHEDVVRRMVANGAGLIASPSLDAIHWGEKQHLQHAKLFQLRAAENNRWIIVSATSGVTQIINPSGKQISSIPIMDPGYLVGEVEFLEGRTLFNRFGYLIGPICLYLSATIILCSMMFEIYRSIKRLINRKSASKNSL